MKITEKRISGVVVLNLEGSLMGGPEAVSLNETVNRYLDEKCTKLILDFQNVQKVNSSGLGILIKVLTTFKTNGGILKLANVNPSVKNLLKITRLHTILDIYDSVPAAIDSF